MFALAPFAGVLLPFSLSGFDVSLPPLFGAGGCCFFPFDGCCS